MTTALLPLDPQKLPQHIAIIMDGNRRWAKRQGWMAVRGHTVGARTTRDIIQECVTLGIRALTLYTFSTENWKRPNVEVAALMRLITRNLDRELPDMRANNIQVRHIGRREGLPDYLLKQLDRSIEETSDNSGLVLNLALNYGGRAEIADAFRTLLHEVQAGSLRAEDVDESHIQAALYTNGLPEPDLMIRTGGEMRISNFLPWQIAYAELWVTPLLWPDFKPADLRGAIADFQQRDRRFGGVKDN
ncbi:MAG TPA: isoprenyl transferase [Abditibacteriaceae bacterium]|nr:isoprenyl transferase [Abditibacteriaceae bacterium]